jgi:hypothetical protein
MMSCFPILLGYSCLINHQLVVPMDALIATKMNNSPGGKQPKMHCTWIPNNNQHLALLN